MKLNLLPTTVSKGKQAKSGIIFSVLIAIVGAIVAIYVSTSSAKALADAKQRYEDSVNPAQQAYDTSTKADAILNAPSSVALIRDAKLAEAMIKHNDVYPYLYDSLKPYIPSFYRVNSIFATPASKTSATITLVGTIKTYQQYADLMLAFSRYPGLVSIGRAGYQLNDAIVPNLSPEDQSGTPHRPSDGPVPDDKLARLTYFESQVQPQGYTGIGNFGSGTDSTRGAMPDYSLVTVTLTVDKDLSVPLPKDTLSGGGASSAPAGLTGAGGPPGKTAGGGGAGAGADTGAGASDDSSGASSKGGKSKKEDGSGD